MRDADKTKAQLVRELAEARLRIAELEGGEGALLKRVRRLEAHNEVIRNLSATLDLKALGKAFEACIRGHLPFDRVQIVLVKDDRHFESLMTGEVLAMPAPIGEIRSASDWVLKHRQPLIRRDLLSDDRFLVNDRLRSFNLRSDIILPLICRGEAIGALSVASCEVGRYGEADLEFLKPLADHIAMVIDNARLYRDLGEAYREIRLIYDCVSDLIFLLEVGPDGVCRIVSANRTYLAEMGFSEAEVVGKRVEEVLPEPAAGFVAEKCQEAMRKGRPVQFEGGFDLPRGYLTLETTLTPIFGEDGVCRYLLGVCRNVTERRRIDREIIRLERLHALEEMAKGFAHNFNNILVGVLGYAQIIEMQSQEPQTVENARRLVENALRAKDLVRRLNLSVRSRGDNPPRRVDSLNAIVEEAVAAARLRWKDEAEAQGISIEVTVRLKDIPAVRAAPMELHQVLVHLIFNAVDAMPDGGKIDISTRAAGERVALQVQDTGIGMDEETQKQIFEPFFTTRQDVGSGLGLSVAYRAKPLVREHATQFPIQLLDISNGEGGSRRGGGENARVPAPPGKGAGGR